MYVLRDGQGIRRGEYISGTILTMQFHSDERSPFGPITMLYSMWHASTELEGYGQQGESSVTKTWFMLMPDAHSFFLAALEQIHAHAKGQLSSCNCIARKFITCNFLAEALDQTFSGALSSSVTCSKCKTKSTTVDPILDLQLDFPTDPTDTNSLTLTSMLRRFCAAEKVGDATKGYDCSNCRGGPGVVSGYRPARAAR
jgi:ubiquitin carboxyl-terminal hydrolase 22/27/51